MYQENENRRWLVKGLRDGIPIALGYFAVSIALGITAKNSGLNALQAALSSILCYASAGEYAGFRVIAENAPYIEMALITLIINARYALMSTSLSQKLPESASLRSRFLVGLTITDEIFGASCTRPGYLNPYYSYGLAMAALPFWWLGTALGVVMGNVLPAPLVSALSVSLYGMFLAIIMSVARRDKVIRGVVFISMAASWAASAAPVISNLSEGTRIIILTVAISMAAAVIFPVDEEKTGAAAEPDRGGEGR